LKRAVQESKSGGFRVEAYQEHPNAAAAADTAGRVEVAAAAEPSVASEASAPSRERGDREDTAGGPVTVEECRGMAKQPARPNKRNRAWKRDIGTGKLKPDLKRALPATRPILRPQSVSVACACRRKPR
jgi:hypothetical protein